MLRTVIAEDDEIFRRELSRKLAEIDDIKIEYITDNGIDLLNALRKIKPELALLDIKLDKLTAIDAVNKIREDVPDTELIFITSYEEYIKDAIKLYAADYIIKPVNYERLKKTIERIKRKFIDYNNILQFKCGDYVKIVNINDLYFIEASRKKCRIYTSKEDFLADISISQVYDMLDKNIFFRTGRSYIVNILKIYSLEPINRTSFEIKFKNKLYKAYLSKKLYKKFREKLKNALYN